ncbi:MAG: hypothetical protein QG632_450 [Candidatus Dependentiae bacterium]|nr:hypothetical protein [Candidatus Dependentiae bacterium]
MLLLLQLLLFSLLPIVASPASPVPAATLDTTKAESLSLSKTPPAPKKRVIGSAWQQATQWVYLPSIDDSKNPQKQISTPAPVGEEKTAPTPPVPTQQLTPENSQQFLADLQAVLDEDYDDEYYGDDDLEAFENLPPVQLSPQEEAEFTAFLMNAFQGNSK